MPAIFIGIGGVGGHVVGRIRKRIDQAVLVAGPNEAVQVAAAQYRFLHVDTWRDEQHAASFQPHERIEMPMGPSRFDVDRRNQGWFYGDDPYFSQWWPERGGGGPMRVSDYAVGAGQLRIKGKLAYRIALTDGPDRLLSGVQAHSNSILTALGPAHGGDRIPVYLVCSLGGGTGSGLILMVAQRLRESLPGNFPIIGTFMLADVTAHVAGEADAVSVRANTDACLREIDYCQRVAGTVDNDLVPFLRWPGAGNELELDEKPFELIYLFGHSNRAGLNLSSVDDYEGLMADCLVAENLTGLAGQQMAAGIQGPHANFLQRLHGTSAIGERPTGYASAAIGELQYPVARIEQHLGRQFGIRVMDRMGGCDQGAAGQVGDSFLENYESGYSLRWDGTPPLRYAFDETLRPESPTPLPKPIFSHPHEQPTWAQARRDETEQAILDKRRGFQDWLGIVVRPYLRAHRERLVADFSGPEGRLQKRIFTEMERADGSGLAFARALLAQVINQLKEQAKYVDLLLLGDQTRNEVGLAATLKDLRERWDGEVQHLLSGFSFLSKRNPRGKENFAKGYWIQWTDAEWEVLVLEQARSTYLALLEEANRVEQVLDDVADHVRITQERLRRLVTTDLDQETAGRSVLQIALLDDPALVKHHFGARLDGISIGGVPQSARAVTTDETDGVVAVVRQALDADDGQHSGRSRDAFRAWLESRVVAEGRGRLGDAVDGLSVWDALRIECDARRALGLIDSPLSDAQARTDDERKSAEAAGLPGQNWEARLFEFYVLNKLRQLNSAVRPFWSLDATAMSNDGQPEGFVVLALDLPIYAGARDAMGLPDFLPGLVQQLNAGQPYGLPGKDAIVLYSREGVVPLYYLDVLERDRLHAASVQMSARKYLYTDRRFPDLVDPAIEKMPTTEEQIKFALTVGLELALVQMNGGQDGGNSENGSVSFTLDGTDYSSMPALLQAVREDNARRTRLFEAFNRGLSNIDRRHWDGILDSAASNARRRANVAPNAAESTFWRDAAHAIIQHRQRGQYIVRA